jgi:serine/threonine protein kinase
VHGDIRCCNIIFQDNKQGRLIDFDFGGKNNGDTTKYPRGYQGTLFDGSRPGKGGSSVTKRDDWLSLRYVIFSFHNVVPPEHASSVTYEQLLQRLLQRDCLKKGLQRRKPLRLKRLRS